MKSEKPEPRHMAYIDCVRGLAFLGVLSTHAVVVGSFPFRALFQSGEYGVQLFFLASAITPCYSMDAEGGHGISDAGGRAANAILFIKLFVVALLLTVAVSTATLHLIEKPGIKVGKIIIRWISLRYPKRELFPAVRASDADGSDAAPGLAEPVVANAD